MSKSPKILKEISVKSHPMKTKHGVTTVKQHKRLEEVNVQENADIKKQITSITDKLKDFDPTSIKDMGKVLKIYTEHFSTIQGKKFNNLENSEIENAYKIFGYTLSSKSLVNPEKAMKIFIDPIFVNKTSQRSIEIEDGIRKLLNVETERIDPFTFRFENLEASKTPKITKSEIFQLDYAISELKKDKHNINEIPYSRHTDMVMNDINENHLKDNIDFKKIQNSIIPSKMFQLIAESINTGWIKRQMRELIEPISLSALHSIQRIIDKNGGSEKYLYMDTEKLRKDTIMALRQDNQNTENNNLIKALKQMKTTHIIPSIEFISRSGYVPSGFLSSEKFMKAINNISVSLSNKWKSHMSNPHSGYLYASNNPVELLNMSPVGNFESCQSLTDDNGNWSISGNTFNILASMNTHNSGDFILMSLQKTKNGNEKTARLSLNHDRKTGQFKNWENGNIYGSDSGDMDNLTELYLIRMTDSFAVSGIMKKNEDDLNDFSFHTATELLKQSKNYKKMFEIFSQTQKINKNIMDKKDMEKSIGNLKDLKKEYLNIGKETIHSLVDDRDVLKDHYDEKVQEFLDDGNSSLYHAKSNMLVLLKSIGIDRVQNYIKSFCENGIDNFISPEVKKVLNK